MIVLLLFLFLSLQCGDLHFNPDEDGKEEPIEDDDKEEEEDDDDVELLLSLP